MLEYLDLWTVDRSLLDLYWGYIQQYYGQHCVRQYLRSRAPPRVWVGSDVQLADYQNQRVERRPFSATMVRVQYAPIPPYQTSHNIADSQFRLSHMGYDITQRWTTISAYTFIELDTFRTNVAALMVDGTITIWSHYVHGWKLRYSEQLDAVKLAVHHNKVAIITTNGDARVSSLPAIQWNTLRREFVPWVRS